jgi:hypothetical protein
MVQSSKAVGMAVVAVLALVALACTCGPLSGFVSPDTDAPPTYTYNGSFGEQQFDSYTARYTVIFEGTNLDGNNPARLDLTTDIAAQRQPARASATTTFTVQGIDFFVGGKSGTTTGEEVIAFLDGMFYQRSDLSADQEGPTCNSWPQQEAAFGASEVMSYTSFGDIVSDALEGAGGALSRVEPNEWVNGVEARHYRIENVTLHDLEMSDVSIDVWVGRAGGHVVRVLITGQSTEESGLVGPITITYDLLSTNLPVDVAIPEGCTSGGK